MPNIINNSQSKALTDEIVTRLKKSDKVKITGIGIFRIKTRTACRRRNPRTGETVQVPEGKKISFKVSSTLKRRILEN